MELTIAGVLVLPLVNFFATLLSKNLLLIIRAKWSSILKKLLCWTTGLTHLTTAEILGSSGTPVVDAFLVNKLWSFLLPVQNKTKLFCFLYFEILYHRFETSNNLANSKTAKIKKTHCFLLPWFLNYWWYVSGCQQKIIG